MTALRLLRNPLALAPLVLSGIAVLAIALQVVRHGGAPQPDEGTAAHVWQLVTLVQLPCIALFAAKWLPRAPRQAAGVLALQLLLVVAAVVPVLLLGW